MYGLRDFFLDVAGLPMDAMPSDELYCGEANLESAFIINKAHETLDAYTYTLVKRGWIALEYNGTELTLQPGDLLIYSPGLPVTILSGSEDYQAICLIADEHMTLESPMIWNMIRTAYYPIVELGQPVIHLNERDVDHMWKLMNDVIKYLNSGHRFLKETLRTIYTLFVLDLLNVIERFVGVRQVSERTTDIFIRFMHLLSKNYKEHHDIAFYANELCITTIHLSRVVRQLTKRTVVDYINQMLLMEASWMLQTSKLSIAHIAEQLHFSDQSSFGKFFLRMKGMSPKSYRKQKNISIVL